MPAIIRYYTENNVHLATFEPLRSADFCTETYWCKEVKERLDAFITNQSLKLFLFKENLPQIIGSINFGNFTRGVSQSCTLGFSVAATEQGKGYMTESLKVAISYVFAELNVHRVTGSYLPYNQRSGKLLKQLGFVVEGYAYDYLIINDQWQDHILASLTNPNWTLA